MSGTGSSAIKRKEGEPKSRFEQDFETLKIVGEGNYGCVIMARNRMDDAVYAVKRILTKEYKVEETLEEVVSLAKANHDGIVRYFHAWQEEAPAEFQVAGSCKRVFVYIQMELCKQTLRQWLDANPGSVDRTRDLWIVKLWFKQLMSGVAHLHQKGMIHRDLKPDNILINDNNCIKICDLGLVVLRKIEDGKEKNKTTSLRGTEMYMSPEQFLYTCTVKSDIFTCGLILTEMCVAMTVDDAAQIFASYRQGILVTVLNKLPEAQLFVELLVNKEPSQRPSCKRILRHPFLYLHGSTDQQIPTGSSDFSDEEEPEDPIVECANRILGEPIRVYEYVYSNSEREIRTLHSPIVIIRNLIKSDHPFRDTWLLARHQYSVAKEFFCKVFNIPLIRTRS